MLNYLSPWLAVKEIYIMATRKVRAPARISMKIESHYAAVTEIVKLRYLRVPREQWKTTLVDTEMMRGIKLHPWNNDK